MDHFLEKYKKIALVTGFVIVSIISAVFLYLRYSKNQPPTNTINTAQTTQVNLNLPDLSPPKPFFQNWIEATGSARIVEPNPQSSLYSLKQNFASVEMSTITDALGLDFMQENKGNYVVFEKYSTDSGSLLMFHRNKPTVFYTSTKGIDIGTAGDEKTRVMELLKKLNIFDESVQITATYKRSVQPNIVFYELHRSWEDVGYPILNPFGLLNIPENQPLQTLTYSQGKTNLEKDKYIFNTSDNKDGFKRELDFNSAVVAVDQSRNKIIKIESNIRPFTADSQVLEKDAMLTKDEAIERLKNGEHNLFFTMPSGGGQVDLKKVYPDKKAVSREAIIEESLIAYLEKPVAAAQSTLEPYYIFKGYSNLESGYRVRFIAAVSVLKDKNKKISFNSKTISDIAGVFAQNNGGQQQGSLDFPDITVTPKATATFSPTNTVVPATPLNTTIPPAQNTLAPTQVIATPFIDEQCIPRYEGEEAVVILEKFEYEGIQFALGVDPIEYNTYSFYYYPNGDVGAYEEIDIIKKLVDYLETVKNTFTVEIPEDWKVTWQLRSVISDTLDKGERKVPMADGNGYYMINPGREPTGPLFQTSDGKKQTCPERLTGRSPSLFIYGKENTNYILKILSQIIFNDPQTIDNKWNITLKGNQELSVNGYIRKYLYYEYKSISFPKPEEGWIIEKNHLSVFSETIADNLKLNETEKQRLSFELNHEASSINSKYLFIGLIAQSEIDEKLSLSISPQIENVQRYHFYLQGLNKRIHIKNPKLSPIKRTSPMIVEFGATTGN
jgi:hypothetical protein